MLKLKPLLPLYAEKLLCERSGKSIAREEKQAMQNRKPERVHAAAVKSAYQHLFEMVLGGNPTTIIIASSIFESIGLDKLYEKLVTPKHMESLAVMQNKESVEKLMKHSLTLVLRLLGQGSSELFWLLGYFPGGVREKDLARLWKQLDVRGGEELGLLLGQLRKANIVTKSQEKIEKKVQEVHKLIPILKPLAVESCMKRAGDRFHVLSTEFHAYLLEKILRKNSKNEEKKVNDKVMNKLWFHETNAWDCIFRALEVKKKLKESGSRGDLSPTMSYSQSFDNLDS